MSVASSLFGYTETDLAVAALLEPPAPSTNDDGEYDEWLSNVEDRAATIQVLTREHVAGGGADPLLYSLERLRRRRNEIEQQMILLVAFLREKVKPRPYTLQQIADAAGLSVSGTRTFYDADDVDALEERIAATTQRIADAHSREGATPGRPTIKIDAERTHPTQVPADDGTLERISLRNEADGEG